ncbi:MAG: hypothetical protein OEN56_10630 [Gemmatimonadota bacterium]|nr:hypothetical protein [Gemmatimonadota bacterium]
MSPRKAILKELSSSHGSSGAAYVRPGTIPGFSAAPDKYQKAVNELLSARLVEGRKDDEGRMTIALNEQRLREIRRELRPFWARPTVWGVLALIATLGAVAIG